MRAPTCWSLAAVLVLLPVTAAPALAQAPASPDRWQVTFDDHHFDWNVRLVRLNGDTLVVRSRDSLIHAPLWHITELRLLPETILEVGDGHRSAIGALGDNNQPVFDLTRLTASARRSLIREILAARAPA